MTTPEFEVRQPVPGNTQEYEELLRSIAERPREVAEQGPFLGTLVEDAQILGGVAKLLLGRRSYYRFSPEGVPLRDGAQLPEWCELIERSTSPHLLVVRMKSSGSIDRGTQAEQFRMGLPLPDEEVDLEKNGSKLMVIERDNDQETPYYVTMGSIDSQRSYTAAMPGVAELLDRCLRYVGSHDSSGHAR